MVHVVAGDDHGVAVFPSMKAVANVVANLSSSAAAFGAWLATSGFVKIAKQALMLSTSRNHGYCMIILFTIKIIVYYNSIYRDRVTAIVSSITRIAIIYRPSCSSSFLRIVHFFSSPRQSNFQGFYPGQFVGLGLIFLPRRPAVEEWNTPSSLYIYINNIRNTKMETS